MKLFLTISVALLCAAPVFAQAPAGGSGYDSMRIDQVGYMEGDYQTGALSRFTNGVKITLTSTQPGQEPVPISANTMTFEYAEGATMPTTILMEGGVSIDHPQASVKAGRADWNLESGDLVFTGDPIVRTDRIPEMRGSMIKININTGQFEGENIKIPDMPTGSMGGGAAGAPANPNLLSETDILDWPGFIQTLQSEAAAGDPSPGKLIVGMLPGDVRSQLQGATVDQVLSQKGGVLKQLNNLLENENLYDPASFEGVTLDEETQALVANTERSADEQIRLNRLLLHTAYPGMVTKG